ncbi:MAG: D-alanyl-D-alanine carboxypeptidase family protein [Lachnospiraceae bacterium]|nr:D-alanyl-D-alanine carboxypeptidase family protein [Lachnospiraceae bacterium]
MTDNRFKLSAFLAIQVSAHNRGIALDMTMMDFETGEDLAMQTNMHDPSFHSILAANNENADILAGYMKEAGFNGLSSEWWHFQDDITRNEIGLTSYLEEGVSLEGFTADDMGIRYRRKDGSFVTDTREAIEGTDYVFDAEGYCFRF